MNKPKVLIFNAEETEATMGTGGWVKRVVTKANSGLDFTFSVAELRPGGGHAWHTHETQDEAIFIISGQGAVSIEGHGEIPYHAGMAMVVPRGTKHQNVNTGSETVKLITMFNPALM